MPGKRTGRRPDTFEQRLDIIEHCDIALNIALHTVPKPFEKVDRAPRRRLQNVPTRVPVAIRKTREMMGTITPTTAMSR